MEQLNTTSYDYGRWSSDLTQTLGSYRAPHFPINPKNATLFLKRWLNGMPEWRPAACEAGHCFFTIM